MKLAGAATVKLDCDQTKYCRTSVLCRAQTLERLSPGTAELEETGARRVSGLVRSETGPQSDLWCKNLPSQAAQEILKRLEGAYRSYQALRKSGARKIVILHEVPDGPVVADNGHYLSIDMGLHSLMTCFDSEGHTFTAGREYLSICVTGTAGSAGFSRSGAVSRQNRVTVFRRVRRTLALCEAKRHREKDYLHTVTHAAAEYCVKNGITRVIIGGLTGIRKDRDCGHI